MFSELKAKMESLLKTEMPIAQEVHDAIAEIKKIEESTMMRLEALEIEVFPPHQTAKILEIQSHADVQPPAAQESPSSVGAST